MNTNRNNIKYLPSGTKLENRYIVGKVLGEGNFGITYVGWDKKLESKVAIKEFFPVNRVSRDVTSGSNNVYVFLMDDYEVLLKKFINEAKKLSKINDIEGIVSVRDFFYENHTAYIIMECINGINLKSYVEEKKKIQGTHVLDMIRPLLDSLEKVHEKGIIHRDISPDNILVTKENKLILIDFGAARVSNYEQEKSLTVMVKHGYSSPEQYRSRGVQGTWSDIYALCATIYYMLTGKELDEAIDRVLEDDVLSLCDIPGIDLTKRQKQVIMRGISVKVSKRYQDVAEFRAAFYKVNKNKNKKVNRYVKICTSALAVAIGLSFFLNLYDSRMQDSYNTLTYEKRGLLEIESTVTSGKREDKKEYIIPSFIGLTKNQVMERIDGGEKNTIELRWKKIYSNKVKKGIIISQKVFKNTKYHIGELLRLELYVSRGVKEVKIPNVIGMNYKKAKEKLEAKKLHIKVVWQDDRSTEGTVIKQSKKNGKRIYERTSIILTISKGVQVVSSKTKPVPKNIPEFDGSIP